MMMMKAINVSVLVLALLALIAVGLAWADETRRCRDFKCLSSCSFQRCDNGQTFEFACPRGTYCKNVRSGSPCVNDLRNRFQCTGELDDGGHDDNNDGKDDHHHDDDDRVKCPKNSQFLCGSTCCESNEVCLEPDYCCPNARLCAGECCPKGQGCIEGNHCSE